MHPYEQLAEKCFWSSAVAKRNMFDIAELWDPKFRIRPISKVATFGSCFAQHIGKALHARGFNWLITEKAPAGLNEDNARRFNYGIFTARTGNIYTASLLSQWVGWASGSLAVPDEVWEKEGRFYDPFRPNIEPDGFESADEMRQSRAMAIDAFRDALVRSDVFVFTLGLTESWFNKTHGYEYPMCPGTVAGEFDPDQHQFVNQEYPFIRTRLVETIKEIRKLNPRLRFLLTVSPVPLTATMSGNHVLLATMESKSTLRSVAGSLRRQFEFVDYFPSYEIINATPYRGSFFEPNQRNVNHSGVEHVMNSFFACLTAKFPAVPPASGTPPAESKTGKSRPAANRAVATARPDDEAVCEEALLNAFSAK